MNSQYETQILDLIDDTLASNPEPLIALAHFKWAALACGSTDGFRMFGDALDQELHKAGIL